MAFRRFLLFLLIGVLGAVQANDFYVVAPNTFRLGSDETIAVAVEGPNVAVVRVFIQDHPGKVKNISHTILRVQPGEPEVFKVHLSPQDFPNKFFEGPGSPKLVSVNVQSDTFKKEITVPISTQSGYVFIQTDKPIYTPKQKEANILIIPLREETVPSYDVFKLQIKNPNNSIVEEKVFSPKTQKERKAFVTHVFKFPTYPVLGEWSATVLFGHEFQQNSTVRFDLEEYVLPTFTVELKTQDIILPSTETIVVNVLAKHVYGKPIKGIVTFQLGIKGDKQPETTFFAVAGPKELRNGGYELRVQTDQLKHHKDIGWFPGIEGSRLVVEAIVVDDATGNKEIATDSKGRFTISPFIISFERCLKDFKPGHVSVFEADIFYADGRPAAEIPVTISAVADNQPLNIGRNTATSDENGKVAFEIQPELHHKTVSITIETNDQRYIGSQAKGNFVQRKFESPSQAYIALARSTGRKLKPGDTFTKNVYFEPDGIRDIYYLVVSRGKISAMNKLPPGLFKIRRIEFEITHEMVPSFRVVVFAHYQNELIADSLKIEVERECNPGAKISVTPEYRSTEPGNAVKFTIQGTKGTLVGLLGVDEAVYALSKKDLLTKSKVFDRFEKHDLGCGPGGGWNVNTVLGNAGITIGTNKYSPSLEHTCVEIKRKKREAALDIVNTFTGIDQVCCSLGMQADRHNRNCQEKINVVQKELQGQHENCSRAFLDCCIYAEENGIKGFKVASKLPGMVGRMGAVDFDDLDFMEVEDEDLFERDVTIRRDFRETWIFKDVAIGVDGTGTHEASLPHSITTWVVQAVSVSPTYGICVIEPQKLVSFKKIFLHLNLPYSVVRNEQVEIQATVFNYGSKRLSAIVYMYGAKDLCSGVQPNEKSERKRLVIESQSAATTTFPVIPLKVEDYTIKVVVLTPEGSDVIEKKLHVVPEGVPTEINIPIKLDPTNQQRRAKRHLDTKLYSDLIDPTQKMQVTAIKLNVPEGFVPGTASCSISAIGDQFGTVIETSINNPDGLLQMPRGCGEQNMMFLAPTLYTMRYLKVTGKLTADKEEKGYGFIRLGYGNELVFRKKDGSYAAFTNRAASLWLTAFVMKVFCQANELIHIDENVLCSGVRWLIDNQEPDGSYIDKNPVAHLDMMGGVKGRTPMTAFTSIALEECKCDEENLLLVKRRAVAYLEAHLGDVNTPLPIAIVAYALALSDSDLKHAANDKLLSLAKTDEDANTMFWTTQNAAEDIETAGYALLTQLLFNDLARSNSIVNWLKTKQLQSGSFKSTQDTVIALQALSEYAIRAQMPSINLVANISSSNDRNFHKVLEFQKDNALILQNVKVDKIGGTLFVNTAGHGMGSLTVKLRYNLIVPPDEICKFIVEETVTETKLETKKKRIIEKVPAKKGMNDVFDRFDNDLIRGAPFVQDIVKALDEDIPVLEIDPRNRGGKAARAPMALIARNAENPRRVKREKPEQKNSKPTLKISLCVRYLGNEDAGMSIVDVGIFSGFGPVLEDLTGLRDDPSHLIEKYEKSSRGVVFYLQKVPKAEKYCFSFRVVQDYAVGNTQTCVIKVYDYYNPDAACTKFYSPSSHSPILKTICAGGVCECAEGGCPPRTPFSMISGINDDYERRQLLKETACDKYDYVWKGELDQPVRKGGAFLNISFLVQEVIKEGIEKRDVIEGEVRTLLVRDNCNHTAPVIEGQTFLILGKDGQKYKNDNGDIWYRYMLDKNSAVHLWTEPKNAKDQKLQRDLKYVTKELEEKGCEQ